MAAPLSNSTNIFVNGTPKFPSSTITGLKRWSCHSKELPPVPKVRSLHVYDFDNTLFRSPLPNPKLWNPYTVSRLQNQDVFVNGGWWHDHRMLEVTGEGIDVEEPRAWSGWWNEQIAELVRLSTEQQDALCVLLTGRGERNFSELIKRMIASKKLDFDLICLKPEVGPKNQRFPSTTQYKQAFLQDLVYTYHDADEIKIYEDRPKQIKGFRDFFQNLNQISFPDTYRKPLDTHVIQVADQVTALDPVTEAAEVQLMINRHNAQQSQMARRLEIRRTVFFTGYMISPVDTAKLLDLVKIPPNLAESEIKYLANSILIVPRPADPNILNRVGGMGTRQTWQVTGFAFYQSNIWAVRVTPVPPNSPVYTVQDPPLIVLATYKNTKPDLANNIKTWQPVPVDKQYVLQTEVGEKVQLRIEAASDTVEPGRGMKRFRSPITGPLRNGAYKDENRRPMQQNANGRAGNQNRNKGMGTIPSGPRGGGNQGRSGRASGPGQGAGRAHRQRVKYRSLDEVAANNSRYGAPSGEPNYDGNDAGAVSFENAPAGKDLTGVGGLPYQ